MKINRKHGKWGSFFLVAVMVLGGLFYLQLRYTHILQGGADYQWPVHIRREASWLPTDFFVVDFLNTRAQWQGESIPQLDSRIYVALGVEPSGVLFVKGANSEIPPSGDYIEAQVLSYEDGIVSFTIPFNRVQMNVKNVDAQFYQNYEEPLIATLKLKDGKAIVTGIYVKGIPLDMANPEEIKKQTHNEKIKAAAENTLPNQDQPAVAKGGI